MAGIPYKIKNTPEQKQLYAKDTTKELPPKDFPRRWGVAIVTDQHDFAFKVGM